MKREDKTYPFALKRQHALALAKTGSRTVVILDSWRGTLRELSILL